MNSYARSNNPVLHRLVELAQYAGMSVEEAKELRALREENAQLKRLVAEAELEKLALREIAKGKF